MSSSDYPRWYNGTGIYEIYWKEGGASIAAIGVGPDGRLWLAPTNWVEPVMPPDWSQVERGVRQGVAAGTAIDCPGRDTTVPQPLGDVHAVAEDRFAQGMEAAYAKQAREAVAVSHFRKHLRGLDRLARDDRHNPVLYHVYGALRALAVRVLPEDEFDATTPATPAEVSDGTRCPGVAAAAPAWPPPAPDISKCDVETLGDALEAAVRQVIAQAPLDATDDEIVAACVAVTGTPVIPYDASCGWSRSEWAARGGVAAGIALSVAQRRALLDADALVCRDCGGFGGELERAATLLGRLCQAADCTTWETAVESVETRWKDNIVSQLYALESWVASVVEATGAEDAGHALTLIRGDS